MRSKLLTHIRVFRRKTEGVAAVEFGLLVPLLFIMFIGTLEIGQAVGLDRRVSMATASTADLIAREKAVDDNDLAGIMQVVKHLLNPYDATRLQVSVVSVKASTTDATDTKVEWTYRHNNAPVPSRCSRYTMPPGLLAAGASALIVEGTYDYEPLLVSHFLNQNVVLQDKATVSPRYSCVDRKTVAAPAGNGCLSTCP